MVELRMLMLQNPFKIIENNNKKNTNFNTIEIEERQTISKDKTLF